MHSVGKNLYELSDRELSASAATCPECGERMHFDWDEDNLALLGCFCGFAVMAPRVANLPASWLYEARKEDAREGLKEAIAALAYSKLPAEANLGMRFVEVMLAGDLAAVAALLGEADQVTSTAAQKATKAIRDFVAALLPVAGEA